MKDQDQKSQQRPEDPTIVKLFRQLYHMVKKNSILQIRYYPSTLCQTVAGPIAFLLILFIIQAAFNSNVGDTVLRPPTRELLPLQKCTPGYLVRKPCITVMYAPKTERFDRIMSKFSALQAARGVSLEVETSWTPNVNEAPPREIGIVGTSNANSIYDYLIAHPNVTYFGVVFNEGPDPIDPTMNKIEYQVWHNYSNTQRVFGIKGAPPFVVTGVEPFNDEVVSLTRGLDEAIYMNEAGISNNDPIFDYSLKDFPETPGSAFTRCPSNPDQIFEALAPVFMLGPGLIIFLIVINSVVAEKENRMKDAMEMIGLLPSVFWTSHLVNYTLVALVNALVMAAIGKAFGFGFFTNTDYDVLFLLFFLFNWASVSFGLFFSSLTRSVKTGIGIAVFFVIVSFIYGFAGSFVAYLWYTPGYEPGQLMLLFPFFSYTKFVMDAFTYTSKKTTISRGDCLLTDGEPFNMSVLYSNIKSNGGTFGPTDVSAVPVPGQSLLLLLMNVVLWFFLTLYFDQIFPNENGYCIHPLYFLFPSYWGYKDPEWMTQKNTQKPLPAKSLPPANEDSFVVNERKLAAEGGSKDYGLRIVGLNKRYDMGASLIVSWLCRLFGVDDSFLSEKPDVKCAIHELSLTVNKGDLLALLGSNGAGKTSTMKILYGASTPTSGDAFIFGRNIRTDMNEIRKNLGVCPQFDLLYSDLTAKEHVELFCGIKGIPNAEAQTVMEKRLKHMQLWNVRFQRAGSYSGGMKRRLSVVLATLGDPQTVFLDEPTTGMDPSNRRFVWSFLEEFKKGRVIILTTHSMEEADILGDKIAIMTRGRLKAVGKSINLKSRFGDGYRVTLLIPNASRVPSVKEEIQKACPEAKLVDEEYVGGSGVSLSRENLTLDANSLDAKVQKTEKAENAAPSAAQSARLVYGADNMLDVKNLVEFVERCAKKRKLAEMKGMTLDPNDIASAFASFGISQATLEDVFLKLIK